MMARRGDGRQATTASMKANAALLRLLEGSLTFSNRKLALELCDTLMKLSRMPPVFLT